MNPYIPQPAFYRLYRDAQKFYRTRQIIRSQLPRGFQGVNDHPNGSYQIVFGLYIDPITDAYTVEEIRRSGSMFFQYWHINTEPYEQGSFIVFFSKEETSLVEVPFVGNNNDHEGIVRLNLLEFSTMPRLNVICSRTVSQSVRE